MANEKLKPIPKDLKSEARKLGLIRLYPKLDTGRKQLLKYMHNSSKIGRSCEQGSILLVGSTGVGKSSTINHLFNLNKQGFQFARVNAQGSETRATTEYVIEKSSDLYETSGLKLGLVDTPGFNDTSGSLQDACNLFTIRSFFKEHPVLQGCYPNLIFVVINADDKRLVGPNSNLSKALKCLSTLDLVDRQHPNVVGIMTHADHLGKTEVKWKSRVAEKKKILHKAIFDHLQVTAKIVAIENDVEDLEKKDEWTVLVDGTKQPLNLFKACSQLLEENGDKFGQILFNSCFEETSPPFKGFHVQAKDASQESPSPEENEIHDFILKIGKGGSEHPLVEEANQFILKHQLDDEESEVIQHLVSGIMRLGIEDKDSLKQTNLDGLGFLIGRVAETNKAKDFLLSLGVKDLPPFDMDNTARVIGQGFHLLNDSTVPSEIFKYEKTKTNFGLLVPKPAEFAKSNETCTFMEVFDDDEEKITARMHSLNVNFELDCKVFSSQTKFDNGASSRSSLRTSTHEYSFIMEQRLFELTIPNLDDLQISDAFSHDVKELPEIFELESNKNRLKFINFFDRWGHFFVAKAFGGGSVELKVNKDVFDSDGSAEEDLKAEIMASFSAWFSPLSVSGAVSGKRVGTSSAKSKKILSQSSSTWKGGDTSLQSHETITEKDAMTRWRLSLIENPVMLQHDLSLLPISDIVKKVNGEKSLACRQALENLLGGKFRLQKNIEEEGKQKRLEQLKRKEDEELRLREDEEQNERSRAEAAANHQPPPENNCFPGSAHVSVSCDNTEKQVTMRELRVGQLVMTNKNGINRPTLVVAFLHLEPEKEASFLKITFDNGVCLTVTENHLLMVSNTKPLLSKMASEVHVGDQDIILKSGDQSTVISVERVNGRGVFCPLTENGIIYVDGVLASCYASTLDYKLGACKFSGHQIAHFGVSPLRWWKKVRSVKAGSHMPSMEPYISWLQSVPLFSSLVIRH